MAFRIVVDSVDLAATNVEIGTVMPSASDLGQPVASASFEIDEEKQLTPKVPREGHEVLIYDDDGTTLLFGGFIRELALVPAPVRRRWDVRCQDYNVRALETATGSLNKVGITDSDRAFVIAIFRDALRAQSFGAGTGIDDPIIAANEPDWPGVQATATLAGLDWSYMSPKSALDNLLKYVPGAHWRIGPDKVLTYGVLREAAPFALHSSPSVAGLEPFEHYTEEVIVGDHRNKMRRGGEGAAEQTAYDEVSYARFGRIFEEPYRNDEGVPASDLRRRTYAELRTHRVRRRASFRVRRKGLKAGQVIDIVNERLGAGTLPAPFVDTLFNALIGRSASGRLAGERGRFLIQKVSSAPLGNQQHVFDVEVGDNIRALPVEIARLAGAV